MGAVLQTAGAAELAAELTCCACSSLCGLAARDSSTRVKFRYCSFLLLATVTCVIVMIPGLRAKMDKIPNLCSKVVSPDTCDKFVGFGAVYRIIFAVTVFHFILALLTFRAKKVNSFRARLNNGLWFFKMGLIFGLTLATFYIPKRTGFFRIWMFLSLTGGFMFLMFQIMLVIDLGNSWSIAWAEKLETGYTKLWYLALTLVTVLLFAVSFAALIAFYVYFTHPTNIMKCNANFFYISFMGMQCILAVAISVTPSVQNFLPGAGLLQSSIVVMYALYLTWNTLSSEPDTSCNPLGNIILEYDSYTGISGASIFGCLVTLVLLIFACTVRTSTSHLGKYGLALAESEQYAMSALYEDTKKMEQVRADEDVLLTEYAGYNYSFFHLIMSFASMHLLMVLTNWHSPEEDSSMKTLVKNWSSVWVQMASSFACVMMYVWFLVTPLVKRVWGPTFGVNFNETVVYEKNIRGNLQAFNARQNQPIVTQQPVPCDSIQPMSEKDVTQSSAIKIPLQTDSIRARLNQSFESFQSEISKFKQKQKFENEHFVKKKPSKESSLPSNVQKLGNISSTNSEVFTARDRNKRSPLDKSVRTFNKYFNEREAGRHSIVSARLSHRGEPEKTNLTERSNNREHKQTISRVSTSTRRSNFYDYKRRRKRRNEFVSRYDTNNSSIETINSWINPNYREKYRPLRQNFDSDYLIEEEEELSPIENSSNVYLEHDNKSKTRKSAQKSSSLTIKIHKSSHSNSKFPITTTNYDKAIDDDTSQDLFRPTRKKTRINSRVNNPVETFPNMYQPSSRNRASSMISNKKKNTIPSSRSMYRDRLEESFKMQNNDVTAFSHNPSVNSRREITSDRRLPVLQQKENQDRDETNEFPYASKSKQNISLVPSVFKRKAQSSEIASEILALQWNILKTQAKIVKIQQRIHNLHNSGNIT